MLQHIFQCRVKFILLLLLEVGGNTEMTATHLREVLYQLAIACDLHKLFASMSAQSILEHHSGCKARCTKECAEQEGHKVKSCTRRGQRCESRKKLPKFSLNGTDKSCRAK